MSQIETVILYNVSYMGYGGMLIMKQKPYILFKNGDVCTDTDVLTFEGGLEAYKSRYPKAFKAWRRRNGHYELRLFKNWEKAPFEKEYPPIPGDQRLNRGYSTLYGAGNTSLGGKDQAAGSNTFYFNSDGRFIRGQSAFAQSEFSGTSVTASSISNDRKGRYYIGGYLLTLNYDDGTTERRSIIFDPDEEDIIWLNGDTYLPEK